MERALDEVIFGGEAWRRFASRSPDDVIGVEDIYPGSFQRSVLWVLDAAITVIGNRPDRIMPRGMVETETGVLSGDVASPVVKRLSPVALIERAIVYRFLLHEPRRYFYADVLKHVVHLWLYRLSEDLCAVDAARIRASYAVNEILDWQNVVGAEPGDVALFIGRVRARLASMHPSALMREALAGEFSVPLRPPPLSPGVRYVHLGATDDA